MRPPPRTAPSPRLGALLALVAFLVVLGVAFSHRRALLRAGGARELRADEGGAPAAAAAAAAAMPEIERCSSGLTVVGVFRLLAGISRFI